ncbi:UNVERIFIED_CONTAM: hypothetical protein PYX00_000213 [Menopon gallinae]|uniref:NADH dehydrogenase [ubiquinone] 1 alpha subcomplex subunit 13 n=1 Tax=Menopon gallinae TaxID=328185 RepID=A0AAW2I9J0_9NEOP
MMLRYHDISKVFCRFLKYFFPVRSTYGQNDRLRMKMFRRLRDEEAELMKNVEGWEVGKYKGEPIYKTLPPDACLKDVIQFSNEIFEHLNKQ